MPTRLNSHVCPCFGCQIVPVSGMRSPIFQPKRSARSRADDGALPVREPRLDLVGRHAELRIDLQERLGLHRDVGEEVRGILVDAVEPGLMRRHLDAGRLLQPRLVGDRQRHDQAHLVNQDQPIEAGDVDAEAERRADRHQDAEQQERDEDRKQRERRAELPPPDVLPDERQELHAVASFRQHPLVEVERAPGALGRVRVVRHHDDGLAVLAVERLQQVEHLVAGLAIEVARRLVAEQQCRVGDDRARDADALFLAAGQLPRIVLRPFGEPHDLQRNRRRASGARPSTASSAAAAARRSARP